MAYDLKQGENYIGSVGFEFNNETQHWRINTPVVAIDVHHNDIFITPESAADTTVTLKMRMVSVKHDVCTGLATYTCLWVDVRVTPRNRPDRKALYAAFKVGEEN